MEVKTLEKYKVKFHVSFEIDAENNAQAIVKAYDLLNFYGLERIIFTIKVKKK